MDGKCQNMLNFICSLNLYELNNSSTNFPRIYFPQMHKICFIRLFQYLHRFGIFYFDFIFDFVRNYTMKGQILLIV